MKQIVKSSGSKGGFKAVLSRKKRRGGVLEDNAGAEEGSAKMQSGRSWGLETGDTTESDSVDMEEECLVEETSFDYGEGSVLVGGNLDQTPKGSQVTTRKALGKPLGKIDFLDNNDNDDILLDASLVLFPPLKNLVNVSVRKSFALDLDLKVVEGNLAQEKLKRIRSLFSGINGFGGASTPSKFSGIIRVTFTSESGLMKAIEKATSVNIMVNTNLKRSAGRSDRAVVLKEIPVGTSAEAVCAALSEFGIIKLIKMQLVGLWQKAVIEFEQSDHADLVMAKWSILIGKDAVRVARSDLDKKSWDVKDQHRALFYTLPMETTTHNIWDFIGSVGGKTCVIDHHLVMYARARCAVICFDSAESLNAIMGTTPVLKGTNLHWSCLVSAKCAKCGKSGHMSLGCAIGERVSSAPVARPVSFGGLSWAKVANESSFPPLSGQNASVKSGSSSEMVPSLPVSIEVNDRFAALEHSLASLAEQMGKLAKRLDALGPMVSQPSPGCQLLVTPSSQNQGADIVISKDSGTATSGEIVVGAVFFNVSLVFKLEDSMKCLMETVLGLLAKVDSFGAGMNNLAKQDDVIHWHMEKNNLVSIFTESKLKGKIHPWIVNKYDGVQMFTSGLESGYLGAGVVVVMNSSLARHMCKVLEVPGRLLSIKLLFKNKLSVSILDLYAGAFSAVWFSQAGEVNSLIAKTVNESFFVVFSDDFNEDGSHKCASFRKCLNLGLVNALGGSSCGKLPTWSNSWGIAKTIDFMFISSNLVNVIVGRNVFGIGEYFDTDHLAVSVLVGLSGLLDVQLNSYDYKGADDVKWAKFKEDTAANAAMFHDDFLAARVRSDLNSMWVALHKVMCLSAETVFKKKWFKRYVKNFSKDSSKFHKLELLVSKLVKASHMDSAKEFTSLLDRWEGLDSVNASAVKSLFLSGSYFDAIRSALSKVKKSYHAFKMSEVKQVRESQIRSAIDKRMESFELDKDHTIRSVLEHLFCKVTLDHLVVDDELVLESALVKAKVDAVMEEWTRKCNVVSDVTGVWDHQYQPLEYVFDDAFSGVMSLIDFDKMSSVVSNLPDGKAAGLSSISNELWKHCNKSVLNMLLVLLNVCLEQESVPGPWKEAWVSMIPKPYECIHNDRVNRVMTNFGLTDEYWVHDGLDQGEVKRQESVCGYRLDSRFVANTDHAKSRAGLTSFLAAGVFVNDTIWIGSSQTATQHILNIVSEFFRVNDISINNDKTVAILINCRVSSPHLLISGLPILIAKRGEPHWYLGIFLSTEDLSKPSLAKACLDVQFFTNLVLRKAISDKQFLYLVSAVLHPIIAYRTQFSFVPISVCVKWDTMICKGLKSKSGLSLDFPNDAIHHPSLYRLKSFEQIQAESKSAAVICFANSVGILGCLFVHRSHDLQVLSWCPRHPLLFPSRINVSSLNNFLAGVVRIFLGCNLSLSGLVTNVFCFQKGTPMSIVLGKFTFYKCVSLLRQYGIVFVEQLCDRTGSVFEWRTFKRWKRLDPQGPIPDWFNAAVCFLSGSGSSPICSLLPLNVGLSDVLESCEFDVVCNRLLKVDSDRLSLFTDGSLCGLGTLGMKTGAAVFFEDIDLGLGVEVSGLVFSIMTELQAIALALECVSPSCLVNLFSDSQAALNACKGHSEVLGNECANTLARAAVSSGVHLPHRIDEHFLKAGSIVVSGNSRHFVGSGSRILVDSLRADVDWFRSCSVWHLDSHLATGFTSAHTAGSRTYFMKALHHRLPVAGYLNVMCLFCGNVEISDHVFSCSFDAGDRAQLINAYVSVWKTHSGLSYSTSCVLQLLFACTSNAYRESLSVFKNSKTVAQNIVAFIREFCLAFHNDIWLVHMKHRAVMEKSGLVSCDGSIPISVSGLPLVLLSSVVRLLGIADALGVGFGFRKSSLFFSGVGNLVSVYIGA
ncbi:hypothetical protein G9A89_008822 [Geosiphon pyriformis]|nr:hypothetical protein G9A89_008822 [Geosiphon pyriformis]